MEEKQHWFESFCHIVIGIMIGLGICLLAGKL